MWLLAFEKVENLTEQECNIKFQYGIQIVHCNLLLCHTINGPFAEAFFVGEVVLAGHNETSSPIEIMDDHDINHISRVERPMH
jgi:hypothetical protein